MDTFEKDSSNSFAFFSQKSKIQNTKENKAFLLHGHVHENLGTLF